MTATFSLGLRFACLMLITLTVLSGSASAKTYYVEKTRVTTFLGALRACVTKGQRLATVTSDEDNRLLEQVLLQKGMPKSIFWIGGTDEGDEGNFIWIDSGSVVGGGRRGYTNFEPHQPDNYLGAGEPENCLEVGRYGLTTWNDQPCSTLNHYICETP